LTGNIWISNKTGNSVTELNSSGAAVGASPFTGDGVSSPTGVAIDGLGNVWLSNSGNNSVSEFSSAGVYVANYTPDAGLNTPSGIGINAH
jgi:streptogramin lyase